MLKCSFVCIFVCLCLSILVVLSMNSRWHFVTYGDIGWHLYVKDEYGNKGALFERGGGAWNAIGERDSYQSDYSALEHKISVRIRMYT